MKHYGDITKINGADVPVVDIVCGGSPCQDLSVAGKRAGLAGERSGLFMEQIRIVKEMRENDRANRRADDACGFLRPRFMVWENVPGAFSSNGGEDFRAVLEEIAKVAEGNARIPRLEKWTKSGCILGAGWSIAWRVHDAQFWGVPQRRKRIALVADFGGQSAPEILFERKGLSGDITESGEEGQGVAGDSERSVDEASHKESDVMYALNTVEQHAVCHTYRKQGHPQNSEQGQGWEETDVNDTLNIFDNSEGRTPTLVIESHPQDSRVKINEDGINQPLSANMCHDPSNGGLVLALENHPADSRVKISEDGVVQTLSSRMGTGGGNVPMVMEDRTYQKTTGSLCASGYDKLGTQEALNDMYAVSAETFHCTTETEMVQTLKARDYKDPQIVCNSIVRRLTPLECERLQGFPDGWTDIGEWTDTKGKKHKDADSPRYKALGNSIALPFWKWMAARMVAELRKSWQVCPTMASLFDGIGGFPLAYSACGCEPIWASEIEEFPIAVTKLRFPEKTEVEE